MMWFKRTRIAYLALMISMLTFSVTGVVVASTGQFLFDKGFQCGANHGALGLPQDQTRSDQRADVEQFELFSQHAMITALCFFDRLQMLVQILSVEEGRGVQPLQLLSRGVSLPVGPRDA